MASKYPKMMGSSGPGGFFFDVLAFAIALTGNN
jgi:hypothetical protein